MAVSFNKVIIAGNLTRDPEMRMVGNDKNVASFGLAINRRYRSNGESKEDVTFVDCECWGRTAELVAQYLNKGKPCLVEGHLKTDSWQDKDGKNRTRLKVVADGVQFLGSAGEMPVVVLDDPPAAAPKARTPSGGGASSGEPPFQRPLSPDHWG